MSTHVLILDFGSQYTQLIARRIREAGVFSEIKRCDISPESIDRKAFGALILSGGPASVTDSDAPKFDPRWLELGIPVLGVCYGMQLISHLAGAPLVGGKSREYGPTELVIDRAEDLFVGFSAGERTRVWSSHGDHVEQLPKGFELLAHSESIPVAAFGNRAKKIYGVQFHPEVVHSQRGFDILKNFLFKISGLPNDWTPGNFIESSIEKIREQVGNSGQVLCALSGGVDSTVAAVLAHRALGNRLHCFFVDNGLLRQGEAKSVMKALTDMKLPVQLIDAGEEFLNGLRGVTDPEKKRKIIGGTFIDVFDREAHKLTGITHLLQGTLYPDVIESSSVRGPSTTIKTHHNVGGLPERMKMRLLEPFRELFKDEVRRVGRELGVPSAIVDRHPFPGPGLAVRVIGEVTPARVALVSQADAIVREEVLAAGEAERLWQVFAVLLPVRSVGVMGDGRTYEETIAVRAVTSDDGMTADWALLSEAVLRRISNRIINSVKGINRVVLDISSKPPATIEWE